MRSGRRVVGIDGCRLGWVVAERDAHGGAEVRVVDRVDELVASIDVIGIDMPIGLPNSWARAADGAARRFVTPRGSTVFPTPPRAVLAFEDYPAANAFAKRTYGKGLTRQTWNLMPKIVEVDAVARRLGDRIVEIHPECAFRAMAGRALASKHTGDGRQQRIEALRPLFGEVVDARPDGSATDDVLDALAVLWSAERYATGTHVSLGDGSCDALGLPMRIVY